MLMPGKMGDIAWTLPCARQIKETEGHEVTLGIMRKYSKILPLLKSQPFMHDAFALPNWEEEHDQCGAQPRIPPLEENQGILDSYDKVYYLGYCGRPQEPLVFNAFRSMHRKPIVPMKKGLFGLPTSMPRKPYVAYAFTPELAMAKEMFLASLMSRLPAADFVDLNTVPIERVPFVVGAAEFYLGCRSLNYVLACLVGQSCAVFEPNAGRREHIFGYPWGTEVMLDGSMEQAERLLKGWVGESPQSAAG